jgi:hypothetical protein
MDVHILLNRDNEIQAVYSDEKVAAEAERYWNTDTDFAAHTRKYGTTPGYYYITKTLDEEA